MAKKLKHSYWLERNRDNSIQLNRVTWTPQGWVESGSKRFEGDDAEDQARAYLPAGLVRSWPVGYGMSQVIEYWNEKEGPAAGQGAPVESR